MLTKIVEIRDSGTAIYAMIFRNVPDNISQEKYFNAYGYATNGNSITLMNLYDQKATNDPYEWKNRTMSVAHQFIYTNFDSIVDGQVIDVEFILGETKEPKMSQI